jgi:WD40 repeat protein
VSPAKPEFNLTRVPPGGERGATDAPEIIAVTDMPWAGRTDRRGFLGAGLAAGAALLVAESDIARAALKGARIASGGCLWAFDAPVLSLAASPTEAVLVSGAGGSAGAVKIWGLPQGNLIKKLTKDKTPTLALAVAPDGDLFATGEGSSSGSKGTLKLWDLPSGALDEKLGANQGSVSALAISGNGELLASVCSVSDSVVIWSLPAGTQVTTLSSGLAYAVALNSAGSLLAAGGSGGFIKLWSLPGGTLLETVAGDASEVFALAMSQDGTTLYSGGMDGTIRCWSLPSLTLTATLTGHTAAISALAVSPSGALLASGSYDQEVKLWNLPSGSLDTTMTGHTNWVSSVAFDSTGTMLASGGYDKTIRLWDVQTGQMIRCLVDMKANPHKKKGTTVTGTTATGQTVSWTQPCGAAIPAGAVCTCNCVPGGVCSCVGHHACSCVGHKACTCNAVCTCQSVCTCVSFSSHYWYPN